MQIKALLLGAMLWAMPHLAAAQEIEIQTVPLSEKTEAWLVESSAVPVINVQIDFIGAGVSADPKDQQGRAMLLAGLLKEGAGDLKALEFQQALEDHAIKLGFGVEKDRLSVSMRTLSEHADKAFELMGMALSEPRLDQDAIDRAKAQQHATLRQMEEQPRYTASQLLKDEIFGDHPYANPSYGTHEGIDAVNRTSLEAYAKQAITLGNIQMAVVGDVKAERLNALVAKHFAGLKTEFEPLIEVPDLVPHTAGQTVVERRTIPQTVVMVAGPGIARNDPDFYAAFLMNHLLGGSTLTSKLGDEIREKRGLAYYAYSSLSVEDHGAWVSAGFGTRNDQAADALSVMMETIHKTAEGEITQEELDDAKGYLIGAFPLALADNDGIAGMLMAMQRFNLGKNYIKERNDLLAAVTLDDVKRVAARLLDTRKYVVVGVGDPSKNLADYR